MLKKGFISNKNFNNDHRQDFKFYHDENNLINKKNCSNKK